MTSSTLLINAKTLSQFAPTKRFNYHQESSITSLDFDDLGQFLILAAVDRLLQLYDVYKGKYVSGVQLQKYGAHLAKFTHGDRQCLYASAPGVSSTINDVDNLIRYLSLETKSYLRYFKGHKEQVLSLEVHPVNEYFITSSMDCSVKTWDIRSATPSGSIDVGSPSMVAYDPMGVIFAVVRFPDPADASFNMTANVDLYDAANCDKLPFLKLHFTLTGGSTRGDVHCTKVEFSNTGKNILISTNRDHYVLDAFTGELLSTIPGEDRTNSKYLLTGLLTFTPDGNFILVGRTKGVGLFNLQEALSKPESSSKWLPSFKTIPGDDVSKIVLFNPKLLAFASADSVVNLWQPID